MTLLVYAVTRSEPTADVASQGLDGRPLRTVTAPGGLAAIVSDSSAPPMATEEALLCYEGAVEAVMNQRAVLPVRFGTTVPDEATIAEFLGQRHDQLASALQRVEGAVEIGVRANWPPDDAASRPDGTGRGTAYLRRRLEQRRRAQRLAEAIDEALSPLARDRACRVLPRPQTPMWGAYLVDRDRVDAFTSACDRLHDAHEDAEIVWTGPWPPYSFAGGEDR